MSKHDRQQVHDRRHVVLTDHVHYQFCQALYMILTQSAQATGVSTTAHTACRGNSVEDWRALSTMHMFAWNAGSCLQCLAVKTTDALQQRSVMPELSACPLAEGGANVVISFNAQADATLPLSGSGLQSGKVCAPQQVPTTLRDGCRT